MGEELKNKSYNALKTFTAKLINSPDGNVSEEQMKVQANLCMMGVYFAAHSGILKDKKEIINTISALVTRLQEIEELPE